MAVHSYVEHLHDVLFLNQDILLTNPAIGLVGRLELVCRSDVNAAWSVRTLNL